MSRSLHRPVIAVLLDYENEGSFSSRPHHALRLGYFDAIEVAGGTPIAVPYLPASMAGFLDIADGIVLPGGFYPSPNSYYGETPDDGAVPVPTHPRVAFEVAFAREILNRDIPVLGICAGMQVLAVMSGATMYRDVHAVYDTTIDHLNEQPAEDYAHTVSIVPDTLLHRVTGLNEMQVNTAHREGIVDTPDSPQLVINARAPDGVVEGIELPRQRFALGVQWHPEFFPEPGTPHLALFKALVDAAGGKVMEEQSTGRVA